MGDTDVGTMPQAGRIASLRAASTGAMKRSLTLMTSRESVVEVARANQVVLLLLDEIESKDARIAELEQLAKEGDTYVSETYVQPYRVQTQIQKVADGFVAMVCLAFRPWVIRSLDTKSKKVAEERAPAIFADLLAGELFKLEHEAIHVIKVCQATWETYSKEHGNVRTPE